MGWGSGTYPEGVYNKDIPGTYINIKVNNTSYSNTSERGYLACPIELPWGSDDEVIKVTAEDYALNCYNIFGYTLGSQELVFIDEMFKNASTLYLYRLNSGGEKATGTFGTARCSGEFGNKITIVVEEDPNNPNEPKPEPKPVTVEINEVEANKEYNVVYSGDSVEEQKIKIEVTKDSEDITSSSDVVTIGESGTTRNVKLTETAESGTYKIIAKYDNEEKKSQEFTYTKD